MARLEQLRATNAAAVHASVLVTTGALPGSIGDSRLDTGSATPIHDANGEVLLWRTPLRGREAGYVDVAADGALGGPIVAVAPDAVWTPDELLAAAGKAFGSRRKADDVRFVAYSFPKLAVQFLRDGEELAMLELYTWAPVPPAGARKPESGFERRSYLEELPAARRRANEKKVDAIVGELVDIGPRLRHSELAIQQIEKVSLIAPKTTTEELHFSDRSTDHKTCFELRGQETNVWCVGASTQMLLDFYRYEYTQTRLAKELGLGTKANPNGLPYSDDAKVVTVIEKLTGKALDATMLSTPTFAQFKTELNANRPCISFVPGHSRAVAGYTETRSPLLAAATFQGLLVFDPWPPNAGVVTRWENYSTQTYRRTFTAKVKLVP